MVVASSISCLIVTENASTATALKQSISIGMLLSSSSNMYRIFSWISLYSDLFLQRYTPILSKVSILFSYNILSLLLILILILLMIR